MEKQGLTIFITGAAGYVGGMLSEQFSTRDDVAEIIALDKEPEPGLLEGNKKITWIDANTSDDTWQERVRAKKPDVVIHCAWQIRELYGKSKTQWDWNVEGSKAVFEFAFGTRSVKKLIYFSTASSYGAYPTNTLDHVFKESEGFRDEIYLYAIEKKEVEEYLLEFYNQKLKELGKSKIPQVAIVRPAAITGPRGRNMFTRFGLMATLRNKLPDSPLYKLISFMVNRIPIASEMWCRQLIHEDDVYDIMEMFTFNDLKSDYDVFNITPPGPPVMARDMAEIVNKRTLRITPWMVRFAFFWFWHLTRGKVATSPGGWRFYTYPIVMDGSKISKVHGYKYKYQSREALEKEEGRYKGRDK